MIKLPSKCFGITEEDRLTGHELIGALIASNAKDDKLGNNFFGVHNATGEFFKLADIRASKYYPIFTKSGEIEVSVSDYNFIKATNKYVGTAGIMAFPLEFLT